MNPRQRFLALILALASGCAAAADVGRVVLVAGDTSALRQGQVVRLAFGAMVQDRDVLRTGAASNLQVRFADDSYVSLRESSELRVDQFNFTGAAAGKESAVFSLLKGGVRAVTGLIGRRNHDDYRMVTPTATIGIRGTDYAATFCQGDCRNPDGSAAKDGVYGRVIGQSQGTNQIHISNDAGQKTLGINSNFFVGDRKAGVELLLVAPEFVLSKLEGRSRGGSKGESGGTGSEKASSGGASEESRPSTTPDPLPQLQFVATNSLGPNGTSAVLPSPANGFLIAFPGKTGTLGDAFFDDDVTIGTFNSQNQLISATGGGQTASLAGGSIVDAGSYTLGNQTFVSGRWTGATSVPIRNGSTVVQTTGVPLLFGTATGVIKEGSVVGSLGGVATYSYVGGPRPVDGGGNVGNITSTSTTINFTTLQQTLSLGMSFPSILVGASNMGPATFNLTGTGAAGISGSGEIGGSLTGSCSGGGCLTGSPTGFFHTGLTGPVGYELAPMTGLVSGTKAGEVAFLNLYQSSSFTPGPTPTGPLRGQVAWSHPAAFTGTLSVDSVTGTFNSSGALIGFVNLAPCSSGSCFLSASLGAGTLVAQGSTTLVDGGSMSWGRWNGGQITERVSGTLTTYTPVGGVPFVIGTSNVTLPTSGSFVYSFAGGPAATNAAGAIGGTLTQGALNISFGANLGMSVATPLQFSVGGGNFSLNQLVLVNSTPCSGGNCTVPMGLNQSMNFSATCSGSCTSVTQAIASAAFVGPQAGGYAVAGNVVSNQPTVTFAGAFKRP